MSKCACCGKFTDFYTTIKPIKEDLNLQLSPSIERFAEPHDYYGTIYIVYLCDVCSQAFSNGKKIKDIRYEFLLHKAANLPFTTR
jgi:hypothetical protein